MHVPSTGNYTIAQLLAFSHIQDFIDKARIFVKGGTGGQGSVRLATPGGDGGDVVIEAVPGMNSLREVSLSEKSFKAGTGSYASDSAHPIKGEGLGANTQRS
jgi:GTPase involved in cell partitioning and DNA repair